MGLSRCNECETVEGDWETTEDEDGYLIDVCHECGALNSREDIPEHDDGDHER